MTSVGWPFAPTSLMREQFGALDAALARLPDERGYRELLWEATLRHAAAVPRYAGRLGAGDVTALPYLTAADVAAAERRHDLYHPDMPRELIFSSGGTSGRAKLMPHAFAQLDAMSRLEEAQLAVLGQHDDYTPYDGQPFTRLRLLESFHGPRVPWPNGPAVRHLALPADEIPNIPAVQDVLDGSDRNPVRDRPVTELIAAMPKLIAVTSALHQRGFNRERSRLRRIQAGGTTSPARRRRWFEDVLGGRFVELYGSTEVWQGNCQRCQACGHFHEPRTVVHEYRETELPGNHRELVLTTLVPFALTMPLLRYRTGDIVRLGPTCRVAGRVGFDIVGRAAHVRYFPDDGLILSPLPIVRLLWELPGLRRLPFDDMLERDLPIAEHLRPPVYDFDATAERPRLRVELSTSHPDVRTEAAVTDQLTDALSTLDPRIPEHLQVELVPADALRTSLFL